MSTTYYETITHRHMPMYVFDGKTKRFEYVAVVHKSRGCDNCHADGLRDDDWINNRGVEDFGRCMNLCGQANADDPAERWCDQHQTVGEFRRNVRRPASPALDLVTTDKDAIA